MESVLLMKIAKVEPSAAKANVRNPSRDQGVHRALPAISATSETATTHGQEKVMAVFASARKRAFAC